MEIFISWSGQKSGAVATALHKWLPKVVNAFRPWLSAADIDKGARWNAEVSAKLATVKAGIFCLTPDNLSSQWLLFEAGALAKTLEKTFVCTLLVGLEPSDVEGPLSQFQATRATRGDVLKLVRNLNKALGEEALKDALVDEVFEVWWPKLKEDLDNLPREAEARRPKREDRDLLEEILNLVRSQSRNAPEGPRAAQWGKLTQDVALTILSTTQSQGLSLDTPTVAYQGELDGRKFRLALPADTPREKIETYVRAQLSDFVRAQDFTLDAPKPQPERAQIRRAYPRTVRRIARRDPKEPA